MAYATLISNEGIDQQFLVILHPRRQHTGFTLFSGSVYSSSFDYGHVSNVTIDGTDLTEGASSSLSAGQWYFDFDTNTLYVRTAGGGDPDSNTTIVTYRLYCATRDEHWYSSPLDSTSRIVYFDPVVGQSVSIKSSVSDAIFGSYPIDTSSISLINAEHIFEKHIYDSSFNKAQIKIYHTLKSEITDDLDITNIKLIYDGVMGGVSYDGGKVSIKCFSAVDELTRGFRNDDTSFYSTTDFPNLDPNFIGLPIRYVYGVVDGFIPVNVDYVEEAPTTSDNRNWCVIGENTTLANIDTTVPASPACTNVRTYVTTVSGFRVGDSIWLDRSVGTDEYVLITAVGANYVEHAALAGGAMASGDHVKRGFVATVYIVQSDVVYTALYGRDFTIDSAMAAGSAGFIFDSSMETNLSMTTLQFNDRVYARVYGRTNNLTLGGPSFGSNDSESGNIAKPVMILYDLLKRVLGIPESRINGASFTAANALRADAFGFSIPEKAQDDMPKVKDIVEQILQMGLLRLYIDDNQTFKVTALEPISAPSDYEIEEDELLNGSVGYDFEYTEILSDIIVKYAFREASSNPSDFSTETSKVTAHSSNAQFLHLVDKAKTFDSHHFKEADAQSFADRLSYIFGERQGKLTFDTKNRFFPTDIDNKIDVIRTKLPGFEFDDETERTRSFSVTQTTKNLRKISIECDDQLGIENNKGSW